MTQSSPVSTLWDGDVLGRQEVAKYLTDYLTKRYEVKPCEKGFVLAINAEWGFGKTYLLQKWREELGENYPAIYFDAWQNDFTPEPLVAFIAELDNALTEHFDQIPVLDKVTPDIKKKVADLWKGAKAALIPLLAKKALNMSMAELSEIKEISAVFENEESSKISAAELQSSMEKIFTTSLKSHNATRSAINNFRAKLDLLISSMIEANEIQLPIFIFIDELDRCRPNYAIELLEGIKHLFGVPGIYFVVATNISQLSEAVKAVYGAGFNGQSYLKRFFDLEYSLPLPDNDSFAKALFADIAKMPAMVYGGRELSIGDAPIAYLFARYADHFSLSLRDQQQVMKSIEAIFLQTIGSQVHIHYLFFLVMLFHKSSFVFEQVVNARSTVNNDNYKQLLISNTEVFHFRTNRYRSGGEYEETRTTIDSIANSYLNYAWREYDRNGNDFGQMSFPTSLMGKVSYKQSANGEMIPDIRSYVKLVRHAGGFSDS